jgi:hypothetical protein
VKLVHTESPETWFSGDVQILVLSQETVELSSVEQSKTVSWWWAVSVSREVAVWPSCLYPPNDKSFRHLAEFPISMEACAHFDKILSRLDIFCWLCGRLKILGCRVACWCWTTKRGSVRILLDRYFHCRTFVVFCWWFYFRARVSIASGKASHDRHYSKETRWDSTAKTWQLEQSGH